MKNAISAFNQTRRNSLSENLALTFALPVGIMTAVVWWCIFYQFHSAIAITGWPSIGAAVLINAGFITFIGFLFGYLRGQKSELTSLKTQLSKPKFIFDCITLAVAYTIIAVVLSAAAIYILSEAFKNLTMPITSAAFVIGVFGAATTYSIISTSVRLQSRDIVNALTLFIVGGVLISMVTAQNPYWWEINFSSLGTSVSISSFAFNITLILSGLLLLSLTDYLLSDLKSIVKGQSKTVEIRTQAVKILFILISLSFAGVGLFPWNRFPFLHTTSAYLLVVWFSILIIGMRWFIPLISKQFLANSYSILFVLLAGFLLWQPLHYINQTAYELLAFSLTFIWLVLFLRTITLMREQILAKRA